MKVFVTRFISLILLLVMELNTPLFSQIVYSGTSYSGYNLKPFVYKGQTLYPISYTGSVINGVYYEGIHITNRKITGHVITGKETSSDFFDESVPEEFRINWKKVIGKFAVGTSVVVVTGIVTLATGGTVGYIAAGAFAGALKGSVIGAATDALITGTLAALKGEPKEQVFKESIEAAANGFMFGAITGTVAGGFKSYTDVQKLIAKYGDDFVKGLSKEQIKILSNYTYTNALSNYTEEGGFGSAEETNNLLRNGKINDNVKILDKTFLKARLPQPVEVFRGSNGFIGDIPIQEVNGKINLSIGQTLTDKGFLSTTMNVEVANNFGSGRGTGVKIIEEISCPKGSSGIPMEIFSEYPREAEILFNRGASRKIKDIKKVRGVWHIVTEMVL